MESENILMLYIASWGWFIISNMFLVGAFISVFSGANIGNDVMFIVFILMWALTIMISLRRRSKVQVEQLDE